jgi:hypothetical protein
MFLNGSTSLNAKSTSQAHNETIVPPCRDVLFETVKRLDRIFRQLNVGYYISFGTLLGALHHREIFGWTSDVDLVMKTQTLLRLLDDQRANDVLLKNGFILFRGGERLARICLADAALMKQMSSGDVDPDYKALQVMIQPSNKLHTLRRQMQYFDQFAYVDIYMEYTVPKASILPRLTHNRNASNETIRSKPTSSSQLLKMNPSECLFEPSEIYPLKRCPLRSLWLPCPKQSARVLERHYGPQYATVRDEFSADEITKFGCV